MYGDSKGRGLEGASENGFNLLLRKGAVESSGRYLVCNIFVDDVGMADGSLVISEDIRFKEFRHRTNGKGPSKIMYKVRVTVKKIVFVEEHFESIRIVWVNNFGKELGT